jgi:hypoxanthine phosphoribosyltransferase
MRFCPSLSALSEQVGELACCLDGAAPWLVVGILRGAVIFMADLVHGLIRPMELDFTCTSYLSAGTAGSGWIALLHSPQSALRGRSVLVAEDVANTGSELT